MCTLIACIFCYIEGNLLVEFRVMFAEVKIVKITKSMCSAKQQYQTIPFTNSFVPLILVIKTLLFVYHAADRTNSPLRAVLCFSKCCSYLFVTCHLWLVIVTGRELDGPVSRHVDVNDRE